jgi:hypothetical protein
MAKRAIRCAECTCTQAVCLAAESPRDCKGCSQAANSFAAECCCWQAAHGLA